MEREWEICALRTKLVALRQRIEYLERQLYLTGQCYSNETDCQVDVKNLDHFNRNCAFCQQPHTIRTCEYFNYLQIGDRWHVAKKLGLCFRCLDNNRHLGKDCPRTRVRRIRGCRLLHHRLHDQDRRRSEMKNTLIDRIQVKSRTSEFVRVTLGFDEHLSEDSSSQYDLSKMTPDPSGGSMDSLDSFINGSIAPGEQPNPSSHVNDADSLHFCDGEIDCQQMDELNRLAMLSLRCNYVTPAPSGGEMNGEFYDPYEVELNCGPHTSIESTCKSEISSETGNVSFPIANGETYRGPPMRNRKSSNSLSMGSILLNMLCSTAFI